MKKLEKAQIFIFCEKRKFASFSFKKKNEKKQNFA